MLAKIKGKLDFVRDSYAVIDTNGIGYKVHMTAYALGKVVSLETVELYLHTHVREDVLALYGFLTLEELEMFELLISISGVGPKAGMGILSIADPKTIRTAILNEDPMVLTKVSGVGRKTAERVILELQNKVADLPVAERVDSLADNDSIEALVGMGYSVAEAREALKSVSNDIKDVGEKVKRALQNLGKK